MTFRLKMFTRCETNRRRTRVILRRLVVVVSCVMCLFLGDWFLGYLNEGTKDYITYFPARDFRIKKVKKILLWTPFLSDDIVENERKCLSTCDAKCVVTGDKSEITDSDAVSFHLSNLWTKVWRIGTRQTIRFPTYRRPDQVWTIANMEPPPHLWGDLRVFNGLFNWTLWYRLDSTVLWPYGSVGRLNDSEVAEMRKVMKTRNFFKEKRAEIFGRISNCKDPGRRYRIIKEMQKYLDIDMAGMCYNRPCGDPHNQWDNSCDRLMRKYKFYLAFENAACTDYVTEKYWFATDRDQIPIVNWKGVSKNLPLPNSYINIFDFPDIESLARYIKEVSTNETLYNSYFRWKTQYANRGACGSCRLCRALHDPSIKAQVYSNLAGWVEDDACEKVGYFNNIMKEIHSYIFWTFGL